MSKRKASTLSPTSIPNGLRRSKRLKNLLQQHHSPTAESQQHNLPSPPHSDDRKSKRKREEEREQEQVTRDTRASEPSLKRRLVSKRSSAFEQSDPISYWIDNDFEWPKVLGHMSRPPKRPPSRSNSYTQSTKSGDTPKAWGAKHAAIMPDNGIFMESQPGATIAQEDEELCEKILGLGSRFDFPNEWSFHGENFLTMVKLAYHQNEARVIRDLGPHIMPSPELHNAQGYPELKHIAEGVDAQWTKCTSLCGPKIEA